MKASTSPGASYGRAARGVSSLQLTGTGRKIIVLAATSALVLAGCSGATPQTRSAASGGPAPKAAVLPPRPSTDTVGSRDPRPTHASMPAAVAANLRHGVFVWLPYWNMPAALDSTLANSGVVGTASPFWYAISGDSTIEENPGAGEQSIIDELRGRGIHVVPTVTETDGIRDFDRMLASASRRAAMVRALVRIASSRDYSGLDLDFEDFAVDRDHNVALADTAAARYPAFVGEVCGALHAIGRGCSVTVMPRTTSGKMYWRGLLATWVFDYRALAKVADRVQIMAYDEHAPGGAPGPIAPYEWVEQVIAYASSVMLIDKAELALPAYGYDWSGQNASAITSREAPQLARQNRVPPIWNAAQGEDTFSYNADGRWHKVWYEGATAVYDRARLAAAAGFGGIGLWAAGDEDPALWPMLRALYAG